MTYVYVYLYSEKVSPWGPICGFLFGEKNRFKKHAVINTQSWDIIVGCIYIYISIIKLLLLLSLLDHFIAGYYHPIIITIISVCLLLLL